jgi:hypothetical protein
VYSLKNRNLFFHILEAEKSKITVLVELSFWWALSSRLLIVSFMLCLYLVEKELQYVFFFSCKGANLTRGLERNNGD